MLRKMKWLSTLLLGGAPVKPVAAKAKPISIMNRPISSIDDLVAEETRAFRVCQYVTAFCKNTLMSFRYLMRVVDSSLVINRDARVSCASLSETSHDV
jgi:hypothetical protein